MINSENNGAQNPTILLITSGYHLYREYLLKEIAQHAQVWMFHNRDADWEKPYIIGNTIVPSLDVNTMIEAARALPAHVHIDGVLCWDELKMVYTAELAEALGLPGTKPENAAKCRDKHLTRKALMVTRVPQPVSTLVGGLEEACQAAETIGYPVIVKPRALGASYGVSLADNPTQLPAAFAHAESAREDGVPVFDQGVLIEEYMRGPEVSIDCAWVNGKMFPLYLARKITGFYPHFEEIGHVVDANDPLLQEKTFLGVLQAAHDAVGFQTGVTHTELRLTEQGPKIVEINGRLGGDLIPLVGWIASGISPGKVLVDVSCGRMPDVSGGDKAFAAVRFFYPPEDVIVDEVWVDSTLPAGIHVAVPLGHPGQKLILPPADHVSCRYAYAISRASSAADCESILDLAEQAFHLEAHPLAQMEEKAATHA
ncbi:MAG TPA: ATP-grasp domain-containing protein [Candidatus Angelobacter sp.]|jgi:biotin carboxylase